MSPGQETRFPLPHPQPKDWGYTNKARLRGLNFIKEFPLPHPQPKDWGYTNKARLRGLNFIKEMLPKETGFL